MKKTSVETKFYKFIFNLFPAFRGSGARIKYITKDWQEILIKLPISWRTRNYVGTIFGGSMFAATDPAFMMMLIKILGDDYLLWDKSASIEYKKPGRSALYADFIIPDERITAIKEKLEEIAVINEEFDIDLVDKKGVVHASVHKVIHIRRRDYKTFKPIKKKEECA